MTEPQSALLLRRQLAGNYTFFLTAAGNTDVIETIVCWRKLFSWTFHINRPVTYNLRGEYEEWQNKNSLRVTQLSNSMFKYKRVLRYIRLANRCHKCQRLSTDRLVMLVLADLTRCVYMCIKQNITLYFPCWHVTFTGYFLNKQLVAISTLKRRKRDTNWPIVFFSSSSEHNVANLTTAGG